MFISRPNVRALAARLLSASLVGLTGGFQVAQAAAPARAEPTFFIAAYGVEGARRLSQEEIEAAVYPYLGPDRTRDDVEKARAALEKAYRDRGFQTAAVEVPAQTAADNIIRLRIIEAPVGRLRVVGARFFSPDAVRREAKAFAEGEMPDITTAQAQITELNRLPDRRVNPILRAGVVPGTVDVDLKVSDSLPLHGSAELTNDHNQYTSPLRATGTLSYGNLWQLGHSASFTFAVAPENPSDSEIFAGSYLAPLPHSPFSILLFGFNSNSNIATLGGSTVLGRGYSVGLRAVDQLPRLGDLSQSLSFGFDFKNFDQTVALAKTSTSVPTHYWPLDLTYNVERDGARFTTKASVSVTAGLSGLGSNAAVFENARYNARPEFIHVNLDLTQTERLWRGFELSEHLIGQIADGPLISSEQFAVGGLTAQRGYLQSEGIGDEGVSGAITLTSPSLAPKWRGVFDDLKLFAFVDGSKIWTLQPLPGQAGDQTLASAGVGLQLAILRHLQADVAVGAPFYKGAATHADRPRATFSVKSEF